MGDDSVEVAHEALLREWPRLRDWIEEDAQGRRLRRHITRAATDWARAGRDRGELYRGVRLAAALDWSTDHAFELNQLEREFVTESREASEQEARRARRTNRRLRVLLAGVAVLLAAAVASGTGRRSSERGEARDAETAQLAQRLGAQALVEDDLDLSLLLARQAVTLADTAQTRGYLAGGARSTRRRRSRSCTPGTMRRTERDDAQPGWDDARGGRLLRLAPLLRRSDARADRRAVRHGRLAREPRLQPGGEALAYGGDGFVRLVDARTRELLAEGFI